MPYVDKCPKCGARLNLVSCTVACRIPISPDGFYLGEGQCDTDDEEVACSECDYTGTLKFID